MRWITRSLIALSLTLAALVWAGVEGVTLYDRLIGGDARTASSPGRGAPERLPVVTVGVTETTVYEGRVTGFATVDAARRAELAAPVAGRVATVSPAVADGADVTEGDVLFTFYDASARRDLTEASIARDRANAELAAATRRIAAAEDTRVREARILELRQADLARVEDLISRGGGTASQLDTARLAVIAAEGAVATAKGAIEDARAARVAAELTLADATLQSDRATAALDALTIRAPLTGTYRGVPPVAGAELTASAPLGAIVDRTALTLALDITPTEAARLGQGARPVSLTRFGDGATFVATLSGTTLLGEENSRRVPMARVKPHACPCLAEGERVAFTIAEPVLMEVAILPASAVSTAGDILAVAEDGLLQNVAVDILRRDGQSVVIAAPPAPLSYVVTRTPRLGPGQRIRLPEPAETALLPVAPSAG